MKKKQSQCNAIASALKAGARLTPLEALKRFGCLRLGARIADLRKRGMAITSTLVDVGDGKRVSEYKLEA